jgi:hypothetical protein
MNVFQRSNNSVFKGFLTLFLALTLGFSALAQSGPIGPGGQASTSPVQAKGPLTEQSLPQMLQQLGFQPQQSKDINGHSFWTVQHTADGFAYKLQFDLIKNQAGNYLGYGIIAELTPLAAGPAGEAQMKRLLQYNYATTSNWHFGVMSGPNGDTVCLVWNIEDRNMNLDRLRQDVERFLGVIRGTYNVWGPNAGSGVIPTPPVPPNGGSGLPPASTSAGHQDQFPHQGTGIQVAMLPGVDD